MSDEVHGDAPQNASAPSSNHVHDHDRVRVRKRVKIRTQDGQREHRRAQFKKLKTKLMYVALVIGGLLMIWIGLKMFVRDPGMPSFRKGPTTGQEHVLT